MIWCSFINYIIFICNFIFIFMIWRFCLRKYLLATTRIAKSSFLCNRSLFTFRQCGIKPWINLTISLGNILFSFKYLHKISCLILARKIFSYSTWVILIEIVVSALKKGHKSQFEHFKVNIKCKIQICMNSSRTDKVAPRFLIYEIKLLSSIGKESLI